MNYDQIKSNLVVYLLRVRCKKCFKLLSRESFWQVYNEEDSFVGKKFFDVTKRPTKGPLVSSVKIIFDRFDNDVWYSVMRETSSLSKQISHDKHKIIVVTLFCSSCNEVITLEYTLDR